VHVDAAAGQLVVHLALRHVVEGPQPVVELQLSRERLGPHAEQVHRNRLGELRDQVRADRPAAPQRVVDDDGRPPKVPGVPVPRIGDPVLDDAGRGATAVPDHPVEVRDVGDRDPVLVGQRMTAERDVAAGGVVFEVDRRQLEARPPTRPLLDEVELVRTLQDNEIRR
jgi:hypothetical protein